MQESTKTRFSISYHLKDLLKRDINKVYEVHKWLETNAVKNRDIANRNVSKRMLARKLAAQICVNALEGDLSAAKEIMDRTEGKVADVVVSGSFNDLVKALEAGRSRLLALRAPQDVVVDGQVIEPEDPHQQQLSTDQSDTQS